MIRHFEFEEWLNETLAQLYTIQFVHCYTLAFDTSKLSVGMVVVHEHRDEEYRFIVHHTCDITTPQDEILMFLIETLEHQIEALFDIRDS